jgi:hypothetical protein
MCLSDNKTLSSFYVIFLLRRPSCAPFVCIFPLFGRMSVVLLLFFTYYSRRESCTLNITAGCCSVAGTDAVDKPRSNKSSIYMLVAEFVKPICLPFDQTERNRYLGEELVVTGWGRTETSECCVRCTLL